MKLEIIEYVCDSCGFVFDSPGLSEGIYGGFFMRSKRGKLAYLNAINDLTYKEVDELLAHQPETSSLSAIDRANVLRRIYGRVACDKDEDGTPFEIDAFPPCPNCCSNNIGSWRFKSPPVVIDVEVVLVTHFEWKNMSSEDKIRAL